MADKVRLAVIGCGGIAGAHLNGYDALVKGGCDTFDIVAVCDPLPASAEGYAERVQKVTGSQPRVYADVAAMLKAEELDGADICSPHCFHLPNALECLEGGLHVMVEKPLGITVKASKQIIEAGARCGKMVATAENVRRYLAARATEWAVNTAKMIGQPRLFTVQVLSSSEFPVDRPAMQWRAIKTLTGGGMIMDSGAHFTDMMLHVFGDVDEVTCQMRTFDAPLIEASFLGQPLPLDVEDSWVVTMRFKSGLMGTWCWSRSAPGHEVRTALYHGSAGSLNDLGFPFHPFQSGAELKLADGNTKSREQIQVEYLMSLGCAERGRLFPYGVTDGFAVEVGDFIDAIANNRPPDVDGEAGLRAKALCEACYESATIGKPVKYDDVLSGAVCEYQKPINEHWGI
ncbi:MAG: hypothetical protein AUJ96_09190 [Armatimonadetes bacterium CG2_30_66_41]|nr:MAG: hypothetical protein AUJ96_09190 [Armatimonadetes bacterium CG2_30_66_41]